MEIASNVRYCYNDNAFLVVHVSADHKEAFYRHAVAKGIRLFANNVFWNDIELRTKWGNVLPYQIANYLYLKTKLTIPFTHFQILSPSNLLTKRDLDQHISRFDIVMRKTTPIAAGWMWRDQADSDPKYRKFSEANGLEQKLCTRVDGLAVRDEIFGDFVRRILEFYSIEDMQNLEPTYPQEETILPTYLTKYAHFAYSFGEAFAKTFEPNQAPLDLQTVMRILEEGNIGYLKRISPQEDDPIRQTILKRMSFGPL
jgi:hypothetical protein